MAPSPLLARKPSDFKLVTVAYNHVTIAASPLAVLTILLNTATWPSWNTFNPTATIFHRPENDPSHPLASLFATAEFLAPGAKFAETHSEEAREKEKFVPEIEKFEIIMVEPIQPVETKDGKRGYRLVWRLLDWNGAIMKSRRIHELVENENGGTEYGSWTELGGLFSWPLRWTSGEKKFEAFFGEALESLKEYAEGRKDTGSV